LAAFPTAQHGEGQGGTKYLSVSFNVHLPLVPWNDDSFTVIVLDY